MKVFRNVKEESGVVKKEVFDIIECTYSGKFMGERSITASINWPSPIDFQIGDYVDLEMQSLMRGAGGKHGGIEKERFYIYTMPTIKKTSSVNTSSKGFEHTVTFYPAQHELASVQMRDMGNNMSADSIIYTGFDTVTFYGGAFELMERIMSVLKAAYHDEDGNALWNYEIADAVNEQTNPALERFPFNFSGNTVMDALLKLSDKEGINTTFYINNRTIYVGFKRPYFCRVTDGGTIDTNLSTQTFSFKYGKTSHLSKAIDNGGLYEITKTVGKELPITKLFAYGASRNLNRYYCSDRIASGRYVNRVMLPSFDIDGKTDYIISEDSANKYGIREASKQFEDIYPSLRYMTYGDLRTIKYCIKVKASGLEGDSINNPSYNVARIQCYKVVEGSNGVNTLVEAAPQDDLAVFVHAEGKIVKVVLYGGMTDGDAIAKQRQHDAKVPTRDGANDYIPGSCFLVHDSGFGNHGELSRDDWFKDAESSNYTDKQKEEIKLRQINYTDTFWLTDLYVFQSYDQTYFSRDGYSAWSWPRLNSKYANAPDSTLVNTILGVEPITIVDTSMTAADLEKQQKTFDIYLGDTGFKIDEQNDFGEMVFVVAGAVKVSILDGLLAGREFEVNGAVTDSQFSCVCAYNDDGSINDEFFEASGYSGEDIPQKAFDNGAIWRLRLNRINLDEPDYSNLNIALPNTQINASAGDHLVLLDIFMPDIYIHAAENRLLREARKYLEANDNGTVNYAVTFDKVRMHQVSMYGLQMREGLNVRMIDEDLDMRTENNGRYIVDYKDNPLVTTKDVPIVEREWEYTLDYVSAKATVGSELVVEVVLSYEENWLNNPIRIVQNGTNYDLGRPKRTQSTGWSDEKGGYVHLIYYNKPSGIDFNSSYQIYRNQIVKGDDSETWLSSSQAIDFTKGKYYTVNLRVKDNGYVNPDSDSFLLLQSRNDELMSYKPSDSVVSYHRKEGEYYLYITFRFYLEDSFNDNVLYYPSLLYTIDGRESYIGIQLISIHERDYDTNSDILPYADFTIDSITTKIYDSSNREDSRLVREISATLSEQHNATAWASLMNRVENTERDSENNKLTYQEIINTARRHYQTLLNLRNSIFDPDGTCDQTFLQVMMLQIGADSMNYQLRKTRTGFTSDGKLAFFNCSCQKESDGYFHFVVYEADTLDHYVFTDGEHHGTWEIPSGINATLLPNGDGIYQPYFISIRCPKNGGDAQWMCETVQRKVNEDAEAWYFNWGILTVDSGGIYTLVETRGNAYMYGDNLICGKISDMAQRCYFDLTKGEFALGMNPDGTASLKYIDGVLTIGGPNGSDVDSILERLGLAEQNVTNIASSIDNLQSQIDGEVTSWFLEGEPYDNYRPANEWTDLVVKERHLGDTYTNILPIEADLSELDSVGNPMWFEQGSLRASGDTMRAFTECRLEDSNFIRTKSIFELKPNEVIITFPKATTGKVWYFRSNKKTSSLYASAFTNATTFTLPAKETYGYQHYFAIDIEATSVQDLVGITCEETFTNPEAGKSWRWCNYEDTSDTTFHWHLIADSDATKALAEAAKATAAADGKSKTFVVQPTNYQVGDLWILQSDTDHTAGKKGDILTANTASEKYDESHWSKEVKYTDDTAIENLEIGTRNLLRNSKIGNNLDWWSFSGAKMTLNDGVIHCVGNNGNYPRLYNASLRGKTFELGATYMLSLWIRSSVNANRIIRIDDGNNTNRIMSFGNVPLTTEWQHLKLSAVCERAEATNQTLFQIWVGDNNVNGEAGKFDNTNWVEVKELKLEKGTKATEWTPAPEDVDADIANVDNKAEALEYLKSVLDDSKNTTDITGGIVMTNIMMLKDTANAGGSVNAGMSGIGNDNILLWGGGTYDDAVSAKNNDYKKLNGKEINTLLKKEGTGKIGVFKIDNTKAVVDVKGDDGSSIAKVIIDASKDGGVFVYDSNNIARSILTSQSIDDSKYMPGSASNKNNSSSNVSGSSSANNGYQYGNLSTIQLGSAISFSGKGTFNVSSMTINLSNMFALHAGNTDYKDQITASMKVKYYMVIKNNGNVVYTSSTYETSAGTTNTSKTINNISFEVSSGSITINLCVQHYTTYTSGTTSASYTISHNFYSRFVPYYDSKTIVFKDGLISAYDAENCYIVKNTSSGQEVYMKGLPNSKPSNPGQLYVDSNGNIKVTI